ncbi:lysosomal acid lipase/cholesteryl ester hydrolase [Lingula anatina]|uniref:Lipase n=1 Tax=Lingula anatina TaxID=7574 RepID=A0A1S3HX49_LINAN|nr:lysosomal acid lipase/cholesteryl ester hydrolase [Lingula anatina]XP_013390622.1 lysosomal acid lipase/cholesteryl ester hydrolase [Lingula anatina]XP_013390623.1 lysosomal acid lipase/cholesteryl ester hydrolase [Lingula anatina]XP_013390624.1 lysosomal acid lipase/cholesteryl ester hydrolase [Lingula anatina]|eukprot:XP_013390621.1 lysosomal acid lipase/cholesteryl ester hydrolase [Lingula anatina]
MKMQGQTLSFLFVFHMGLVICASGGFVFRELEEIWKQNQVAVHVDPEVNMDAEELITSKGYPCETHTVTTADGFILTIHRIPHGLKKGQKAGPRPPVFLQHGLVASSTQWLTNLRNESLGYILADAGFDVWMGNVRGNTYSSKHKKYDPKSEEFWDWSWDEMAKYDLPAMIDYTLKVTGVSQIHYVGHSQGTLIMFAHTSQNPDFAKKFKSFIAMGPVATIAHAKGPLLLLSDFSDKDIFDLFGRKDFAPNSKLMDWISKEVCGHKDINILCSNILFLLCGFDSKQFNVSRTPVYFSHVPAGTSVKNMVHYAQMARSGKFQMFDFGSAAANKEHYNQSSAPQYDPAKAQAPTYLYYGQNDWLADPQDVQDTLVPFLPNIKVSQEIPQWEHMDFIWAMDAPSVLYDKLIGIMKQN